MKNDLLNSMIKTIKQGIIDAQSGDTTTIEFENNGMTCHLLNKINNYNIVYDSTNDRLIIAWALELHGDFSTGLKGSWGNGNYFMNEGGNDLIERYQIAEVADTFNKKALDL